MSTFQFTDEDKDRFFGKLATALAEIPLKGRDGVPRYARADEFMLMHRDGCQVGFKHIETRNYVFVNAISGALYVPETFQAFMRGEF